MCGRLTPKRQGLATHLATATMHKHGHARKVVRVRVVIDNFHFGAHYK